MSRSYNRLSLLMCLLGVISLMATGCGGGGGGAPAVGIGADQWFMTANGLIDENPAIQGAPGRLEVPDRQEAPLMPGVGYLVKAVNAETGLILGQTTSNSQGHFSLTFALPKNKDMAIVLVAQKETVVMRALLPVSAQELADLAAQLNFNIAMAVPISMATENKVKEIEGLLGIASGNLGKVALPAGVTVATLCVYAESAGFVLQPEGVFTFTGDVDSADDPNAPTFLANAGADQYNKLFNTVVNLSGTAKEATGSLAGRNLTYQWTQTAGPAVALSNANAPTASFTTWSLADTMVYAEGRLLADFPGTHGKPDRFGLLSIDSHENAEFSYTFKLTIIDVGSGKKAEDIVQVFPVARQSGLANVGKGLPVLLNAPAAGSYNWVMIKPTDSNAMLQEAASKNPYFIPDAAGTYEVTELISGKYMKIYAGNWTGVNATTTGTDTSEENGCGACHKSTGLYRDLTEYFSEWGNTGHGKIFTHEVAPADPTGYHYGANCTACHTVGRELAADNGGFDDLMAQKGYVVPATADPNAWTSLVSTYPAVAALANIQCENCHGPSNSEAHGAGVAARMSMDVSVCGVCHGEPPRHNRNQIWAQSGHANPELAVSRGTSSSCGRCHEAKGFVAWIPQIMAATNEAEARASLPSSALATAETAQPIVCVACHDPHSDANPNQLRIYGDTPFLPAGFQAMGAGKGALCMTCHNTRNGIRSDAVAPSDWGAPHTAAQADVLWGKNAYFVDPALPYKSVHAASVVDTCVTCHMDLVPANKYGSGTNHKFSVMPDQICNKCHGAGATAAPLQAEVRALLEELANVIGAKAMAKINDGERSQIKVQAYPFNPDGTLYDVNSPVTTIDVANIKSLELMEPHGQQGFLFTFNNAVNFDYGGGNVVTATMAEVQTRYIKDTAGVVLFDPVTDPIIKAGWNYFLFEGDGSFGVHNPKFILNVLKETISAALGTRVEANVDLKEIAVRVDAVLLLGYNTTNPDALAKLLMDGNTTNDPFVVDTREAADFARGHIPGSINIPLKSLPQALIDGTSGIPMDRNVVVASYWGNDGNMASFLINVNRIADPAAQLSAIKAKTTPPYPQSTTLFQGMTSWSYKRDLVPVNTRFDDALSGGVRVEKATEAGTNPSVDQSAYPVIVTTAADPVVKKVLLRAKTYFNSFNTQFDIQMYPKTLSDLLADGDPSNDPQIISVRAANHYSMGHIPGAINIPYQSVANLTQYTKFVSPAKPVVVYCYTGHTGALSTMALGILGYDVKNLLYGMNGWSTTAAGSGQLINFDLFKGWDFPINDGGANDLASMAAYVPPTGCMGCHTSLTAIFYDREIANPPQAGETPPSVGEG